MKKTTLCFCIVITMLGCKTTPKETAEERDARIDSFSRAKYGMSVQEKAEKETNEYIAKALLDTTGVYKSPIKVLKARLVKKEYSNYRDIELTFKNVSNKTVAGIRFKWKGINAFNEPADMGSYTGEGYGGGFSDDPIRSGKTETATWSISSRDAKKVQLAFAYEVAFKDGTVWKLKN